jgi:rubrerythrin
MPTTMENLANAFAGESQANRKYLAFAARAERDGFPKIAALFRTAAEAETIHAHGHLKAMGGVKTTLENLKEAVGGETYEYTEMYPPMLEQAEAEGHKARRMFGFALLAEKVHADLYEMALAAAEAGTDLDAEFWLCPICGNIELKKPDAPCTICKAKPEKFVQL